MTVCWFFGVRIVRRVYGRLSATAAAVTASRLEIIHVSWRNYKFLFAETEFLKIWSVI